MRLMDQAFLKSWIEVEVGWKWKLDGSGSWMEVEVRLKWKLDGSES